MVPCQFNFPREVEDDRDAVHLMDHVPNVAIIESAVLSELRREAGTRGTRLQVCPRDRKPILSLKLSSIAEFLASGKAGVQSSLRSPGSAPRCLPREERLGSRTGASPGADCQTVSGGKS